MKKSQLATFLTTLLFIGVMFRCASAEEKLSIDPNSVVAALKAAGIQTAEQSAYAVFKDGTYAGQLGDIISAVDWSPTTTISIVGTKDGSPWQNAVLKDKADSLLQAYKFDFTDVAPAPVNCNDTVAHKCASLDVKKLDGADVVYFGVSSFEGTIVKWQPGPGLLRPETQAFKNISFSTTPSGAEMYISSYKY